MQNPQLEAPVHRGMAHLDRSAFSQQLSLLAARLPATKTTQFMHKDAKECVYVSIRGDSERPLSALPEELLQMIKQSDGEVVQHQVELTYDFWTADQILQAVLPEELLDESPTAFTQVGHIAHLNLRDQYLPHRFLIGQVILDKNKTLRTVVNKLDMIDNVYRNFQMEVLAGDPDFEVEMSEHDCKFRFDFSKVYWNSRLQTEHARLVETFKTSDVVVDGFAGVGPFAVPAGKKGCAVLASDLNPASAEALAGNVKLNKVEGNVRTWNEDGRDFIRQSVLRVWNEPFPEYVPPLSSRERSRRARAERAEREARAAAQQTASSGAPADSATPAATGEATATSSAPASSDPAPNPQKMRRLPNHYIMNLPASALTFLDAFRGLYRPLYAQIGEEEAKRAITEAGGLPVVHCYCFTKDIEGAEADICQRATEVLGHRVHPGLENFAVRFVRDVAPKKEMYCLEFRLTEEMVR
ncbi:tRNA(m(1)G37)methyltransferase [Rhodotorula sphaerocarpa]